MRILSAGGSPVATVSPSTQPYRYVRQDFCLARSFRNLDDLNAHYDHWRTRIANPRIHATIRRVVDQHFAEEKRTLRPRAIEFADF